LSKGNVGGTSTSPARTTKRRKRKKEIFQLLGRGERAATKIGEIPGGEELGLWKSEGRKFQTWVPPTKTVHPRKTKLRGARVGEKTKNNLYGIRLVGDRKWSESGRGLKVKDITGGGVGKEKKWQKDQLTFESRAGRGTPFTQTGPFVSKKLKHGCERE